MLGEPQVSFSRLSTIPNYSQQEVRNKISQLTKHAEKLTPSKIVKLAYLFVRLSVVHPEDGAFLKDITDEGDNPILVKILQALIFLLRVYHSKTEKLDIKDFKSYLKALQGPLLEVKEELYIRAIFLPLFGVHATIRKESLKLKMKKLLTIFTAADFDIKQLEPKLLPIEGALPAPIEMEVVTHAPKPPQSLVSYLASFSNERSPFDRKLIPLLVRHIIESLNAEAIEERNFQYATFLTGAALRALLLRQDASSIKDWDLVVHGCSIREIKSILKAKKFDFKIAHIKAIYGELYSNLKITFSEQPNLFLDISVMKDSITQKSLIKHVRFDQKYRDYKPNSLFYTLCEGQEFIIDTQNGMQCIRNRPLLCERTDGEHEKRNIGRVILRGVKFLVNNPDSELTPHTMKWIQKNAEYLKYRQAESYFRILLCSGNAFEMISKMDSLGLLKIMYPATLFRHMGQAGFQQHVKKFDAEFSKEMQQKLSNDQYDEVSLSVKKHFFLKDERFENESDQWVIMEPAQDPEDFIGDEFLDSVKKIFSKKLKPQLLLDRLFQLAVFSEDHQRNAGNIIAYILTMFLNSVEKINSQNQKSILYGVFRLLRANLNDINDSSQISTILHRIGKLVKLEYITELHEKSRECCETLLLRFPKVQKSPADIALTFYALNQLVASENIQVTSELRESYNQLFKQLAESQAKPSEISTAFVAMSNLLKAKNHWAWTVDLEKSCATMLATLTNLDQEIPSTATLTALYNLVKADLFKDIAALTHPFEKLLSVLAESNPKNTGFTWALFALGWLVKNKGLVTTDSILSSSVSLIIKLTKLEPDDAEISRALAFISMLAKVQHIDIWYERASAHCEKLLERFLSPQIVPSNKTLLFVLRSLGSMAEVHIRITDNMKQQCRRLCECVLIRFSNSSEPNEIATIFKGMGSLIKAYCVSILSQAARDTCSSLLARMSCLNPEQDDIARIFRGLTNIAKARINFSISVNSNENMLEKLCSFSKLRNSNIVDVLTGVDMLIRKERITINSDNLKDYCRELFKMLDNFDHKSYAKDFEYIRRSMFTQLSINRFFKQQITYSKAATSSRSYGPQ